jgi:AraC-like DNA-binding protein
MSHHPAYAVFRGFDPEPPTRYRFDRHYLLYALQGTMRLEADGRSWSLPPARAAWIRAGVEILFSIDRPIRCCSALFSPDHFDAPSQPLTVFEMTPLLHEVMKELRAFEGGAATHAPEAGALFGLAALLAERQSQRPSRAWLPAPQSDAVRRALAKTEASLSDAPQLDDIAAAAGLTPRTLARRFADELGLTWRQAQMRLRMIRAIEYLADPAVAVTEIAHGLGYGSSSAFNAAFRDFTGQTPTAFRRSLSGAGALLL